ncbi:MAG: 3-hydroxyacyl-CoA dehydrogenase family protein [Bacteroidales bacterium]|nr:3-hydroxyacyl-CoA dehydrogenase family protein [Bacteroidales bacterium]
MSQQVVLEDFSLSKKMKPTKGTLHKIAIIGCGSMGQEISRLVSQNGLEVVFIDLTEERIQHVMNLIGKQLDAIINKWGLTENEKKLILSRIKGSTDYNDIKDCNLVVETINSKKPGTSLNIRKEVFHKVEAVVSKDTVITSNTSTLMISDLASALDHPERAVGLHFIAPASRTDLVEVVKGRETADWAYETVTKFAKMIRKDVIDVNESPGNISSRMIISLVNEACELLMEGVASVASVDHTMRDGFGLQFGPFEMADRIGLDKLLKWMDNLYSEFGEQKYKASPVIKRLVRANYLGRRVGAGFYKYENDKPVDQTITCTVIKK